MASGISREIREERIRKALELGEFTKHEHRFVREYSGGMIRRLDHSGFITSSQDLIFR